MTPALRALIDEITAKRALCPGTVEQITAVHTAAKRLASAALSGRQTALTPQAAEMLRTRRPATDYDEPGRTAHLCECLCGSSFLIWDER